MRLWKVGVSLLKSELYGCIANRTNEDGSTPYGYCHFPEYNAEYFKQLTSEQLVTKIVHGYPKREWQKTRDRNEALDCRIYARAAAIALGIDRWSEQKWRQLKEKQKNDQSTEKSLQFPKRKAVSKIVRSSWL